MPNDRDQEIALQLAGTVRLPSPAPATGSVSIVVKAPDDGLEPDIYLKVVNNQGLKVQISRTIHLRDVAAIQSPAFAPNGNGNGHDVGFGYVNGNGISRPSAAVKTGREVKALVRAALARKPPANGNGNGHGDGTSILHFLDDAVVFVPESAPVLLSSHAGMTAAESAGYLAPMSAAHGVGTTTFCEDIRGMMTHGHPPVVSFCEDDPAGP